MRGNVEREHRERERAEHQRGAQQHDRRAAASDTPAGGKQRAARRHAGGHQHGAAGRRRGDQGRVAYGGEGGEAEERQQRQAGLLAGGGRGGGGAEAGLDAAHAARPARIPPAACTEHPATLKSTSVPACADGDTEQLTATSPGARRGPGWTSTTPRAPRRRSHRGPAPGSTSASSSCSRGHASRPGPRSSTRGWSGQKDRAAARRREPQAEGSRRSHRLVERIAVRSRAGVEHDRERAPVAFSAQAPFHRHAGPRERQPVDARGRRARDPLAQAVELHPVEMGRHRLGKRGDPLELASPQPLHPRQHQQLERGAGPLPRAEPERVRPARRRGSDPGATPAQRAQALIRRAVAPVEPSALSAGKDAQDASAGDGQASADARPHGHLLALLGAAGRQVELDARAPCRRRHQRSRRERDEQERDAGHVERSDRERGGEEAHGCAEQAELQAAAHSAGTAASPSSTISRLAASDRPGASSRRWPRTA